MGRFWIEEKNIEGETIYRARGPYGMKGDWCDEELVNYDLLEMAKGVKLSDEENQQMINIYECVHDL